MKKTIFSIFAVGILALALTGCGKVDTEDNGIITLEEYNEIETGISYSELKDIVGGDCTKSAEQEMAGITQAIYSCSGKGEATALFTFQNDSLKTKTQTGLK